MPQIRTKSIYGVQNTPLSASDLVSIHSSHFPYFNKLWNRGIENERYLTGENFSEEQKQDIYNQDRIPFPSAITADKLNRIISTERNTRTSTRYEAKKPEKEIAAELATIRVKKIESDSEMDYCESEVFASGVAVIFGVGRITVGYDRHGNNQIKVDELDYQDIMWDSNARKYNKSDGTFFAQRKAVYRRDIRRDYGDQIADAIEINSGLWGRELQLYWGSQDQRGKRDNDIIVIFEHFQKVLREKWYVVWNGEVVTKENSKKEADKILRILKIPFIATNQDIPPASVIRRNDDGIDRYVFTSTLILEYEETQLEDFPYSVYQSFHFKNKIWCMTDLLKPENKFMDKLISQIDYAFGVDLKNAWEIVEPWLAAGVSLEDAIYNVKNGIPVPTNRPGAINAIRSQGANPQWLQVYGMLKQNVTEFSGGGLFSGAPMGMQREAKETVAMKLRQQQLIATLFTDNLRRWKRDLMRKVLWFISKYDTEEYVLRVHGGELSPEMMQLLKEKNIYTPSQTNPGKGYLRINQEGNELSYLKDYDFDVSITESELSETMQELRLSQLQSFERLAPGSITPDVFLEYFPAEYSVKEKIRKGYEKRQQMMQQAVAQKQNFDQQEINVKKANAISKAMPKMDQM